MAVEWDLPDITEAGQYALMAGAQMLRLESDRLAPKEDGELAASAVVEADGLEAEVGYNAPYAVKQHEHLYYKRPSGGIPKFLETAAITKADQIMERIAERLGRELSE